MSSEAGRETPRGGARNASAPAPLGAGAREARRRRAYESLKATVIVIRTLTGLPFSVAGL